MDPARRLAGWPPSPKKCVHGPARQLTSCTELWPKTGHKTTELPQ
jgi:hypothetical protein